MLKFFYLYPIMFVMKVRYETSIGGYMTLILTLTEDVYHVLLCFAQMGASPEELEQERQRLIQDVEYCKSWCKATGF